MKSGHWRLLCLLVVIQAIVGVGCTIASNGPISALPIPSYTPTPKDAAWMLPTRVFLPQVGSPSAPLDVLLTVREAGGLARTREAVTSGVPIPSSQKLINLTQLRLLDPSSKSVPVQFTPLARWGGAPDDNSKPVRWLLLDWQASVPANGTAVYHLVDSGGPAPVPPQLTVADTASALTIDTGVAQFNLSKSDGRLTAPGLAAPLYGRAKDSQGNILTTSGPVIITVALDGPMRVSIHVRGAYHDLQGNKAIDYTSRYWFYAGQETVRLFHTVENNNLCPLGEYGELTCFDIGGSGSINLADLSLVVPVQPDGAFSYQVGGEGATLSGTLDGNLTLFQDSSGTDHWNRYPTMKNWEGQPLDTRPRTQSYVSFRGYRTTVGGTLVCSGNQAAGWLSIVGKSGRWTVGVRDFWQNFPKALRAFPDGTVEVGLWPDEFGPADYAFNLRPGEHKTHELTLSTSSNPSLAPDPLFGQAPAQWYVDSDAFGMTALPNTTTWPDHEQYIKYQLDTSPQHNRDDYYKNLLDAIEVSDFYGLYDYGDWMIDYEGYEVAPLNTKYDSDYGMHLRR